MATPPTRVAFVAGSSYTTTTTPKTLAMTGLQVGDIVVVMAGSENSASVITTAPTATGITFTQQVNMPAVGNSGVSRCIAWTGIVNTAGSPTISVVRPNAAVQWNCFAWVFRNHGGVGNATGADASASSTGVATSANSAIAVAAFDWKALDGTTRTRRTVGGSTGQEEAYFRNSTNYGAYASTYTDSGAAGTSTVGWSAPAAQQTAIAMVEILGTATVNNGTASGAFSFSGSAAGAKVAQGSASGAVFYGSTLARWGAAVIGAAAAPAKILAIGDSVTEGQGATASTTRWVDKLAATIRAAYPSGAAGGKNYYPPFYGVYAPDSTWSTLRTAETGTVTNDTWAADLGWRHSSFAAAATRTYTVQGTSVDIWWASNGGSFTYQIDGGTVSSPISTAGVYSTGNRTTVSLGASGSHTIKLACTAATFYFEGLTVYDGDAAKGVQMYEAGHTGITSTQYVAGTDLPGALAAVAPDLVLIELGLNDPAAAISTATYQANVVQLITWLKALTVPPSILLVAAYNPATSVIATATWQTYVAALQSVATAQGVGFLDLSALMPTATLAGTGLYSTDGLHPNNSGHTEIAAQIAGAITASTAVGSMPALGPNQGSAAGAFAFVGTAGGTRPAGGTASGAVSFVGAAAGPDTTAFKVASAVASSAASGTVNLTVPTGVTPDMYCLAVIGGDSGTSFTATPTMPGSSSSTTFLALTAATNTQFLIYKMTGLTAGDTIPFAVTKAVDIQLFAFKTNLSAPGAVTIRSGSQTTLTAPAITATAGQQVFVLGVERTTAVVTVTSMTNSLGYTVTKRAESNVDSNADIGFALGEFTATSAGTTGTSTITMSGGSTNGGALHFSSVAAVPVATMAALVNANGSGTLQGGWWLDSGATCRMVVSTSSDLSSPTYSSSGSPAAGSKAVALSVSGLAEGTFYYVGIEVDGTLLTTGRGQGRTLATARAGTTWKFGAGSCNNTGSTRDVFNVIDTEDYEFFMHMGDRHYADTSVEATWRAAHKSSMTTAQFQDLLTSTPMTWTPDNHDWGGNRSWRDSPVSAFAYTAITETMLGYATSGAFYRTYVHRGVRFIELDRWSQRDKDSAGTSSDGDASAPKDPSDVTKVMLGATQEAWLLNLLSTSTEELIIINSGFPLTNARLGPYAVETTRIKNYIAALPAKQKAKLIAIGGDSHDIRAATGAAAIALWGIPTLNASPLHQTGGPFDVSGWDIGQLDVDYAYGYWNRCTITDSGTTMTFRWDAMKSDGTSLMNWSTTVISTAAGTATGAFSFAGSAAGSRASEGTGSGAVGFVGSAGGATAPQGAGAGAFSLAGSASGSAAMAGTGSGAFTFVGAAVASRVSSGTTSGAVQWDGAAVGARGSQGSASGAVAFVGSAAGTAPVSGTAAGAFSFVGAAAGLVIPQLDLLGRWRADDLSGADGTAVTTWGDISGNSLGNAAQATGANQPTLLNNAANGHKGVAFDGVNDRLTLSGAALDLFRNRGVATVFIAYAYPSVVTGARTLLSFSTGLSATTTRVAVGQRDTGGNQNAGGRRLDADGTGIFLSGTATVPGAREVVTGRFVWSNNDLYVYKNGGLSATQTVFQTIGVTSNTASLSGVIGSNSGQSAEFFAGRIMEILVYGSDDAAMLATVHNYLLATYGIIDGGPATGAVDFGGTAAGSASTQGTASGAFTFGGAAAGEIVRGAAASGAFSFTGSASTSAGYLGVASGAFTFVGSANGARVSVGSATGAISFAGLAQSSATSEGVGAGTVVFSGTASGTRSPGGQATGTVTWSGTTAGLVGHAGTAPGEVVWDGSVAGQRVSVGGASGTVSWIGTATAEQFPAGTAAGAVSWSGTSAGSTVRQGTAGGTVVWDGGALGEITVSGAAAGEFYFAGLATGHAGGETIYVPIEITVGRSHSTVFVVDESYGTQFRIGKPYGRTQIEVGRPRMRSGR